MKSGFKTVSTTLSPTPLNQARVFKDVPQGNVWCVVQARCQRMLFFLAISDHKPDMCSGLFSCLSSCDESCGMVCRAVSYIALVLWVVPSTHPWPCHSIFKMPSNSSSALLVCACFAVPIVSFHLTVLASMQARGFHWVLHKTYMFSTSFLVSSFPLAGMFSLFVLFCF